jgi:hypothetical protein
MLWRGRAVILNDKPILQSDRMSHKYYERKCSIEKVSDRGSHGARRQDELIGGKPPVVK